MRILNPKTHTLFHITAVKPADYLQGLKNDKIIRGLVSNGTVVLRQWGVEANAWFSKRFDN